MYTKEICDFLSRDINMVLLEILKQYWNKESFSYMERPRPGHGLMLLISGSAKFIFEGGELRVNAGDMVFIPKFSHYEAVFENETVDYLVNFNSEDFELNVPTLIFNNAPLVIYESFRRLVEEKQTPFNTVLNNKALFYHLVDEIVKNANVLICDNYNVIDQAKILLNEREECSIEDIAKSCNISSSGLRKKFKDSVGMTLSEYRIRQKIAKAKYMLESTNMSISEISEALKFYDAPYFCKIFKKLEGVSPKTYIKRKQI